MAVVQAYHSQINQLPNRSTSHVELIITGAPEDEEMDITSSISGARSENNLSKQRVTLSHSISHPAANSATLSTFTRQKSSLDRHHMAAGLPSSNVEYREV
ncbi:hypothetical protein EB796_017054 [Bugula neritina]|uniref:Uncharacterized protein n=1 Tax=Bugula neritina TaxID=10212 RepID=A0A7J7JEF3_BUGNE|nr:hypothetical protein EB796_017054 [Bugula neritina]